MAEIQRPPDHDRLQQWYHEHHAWLRSWLQRQLGNHATAADLAQDTFVRLIAKPERPSLLQPRAYLSTIARGLLKNHWRRQALEQAYAQALAARPAELAVSPEDTLAVLQALEALSRMLDALPQRVRTIFLLSQMDGLTYPEIASQLGVSVNVVQKAMVRAFTHAYQVLHD